MNEKFTPLFGTREKGSSAVRTERETAEISHEDFTAFIESDKPSGDVALDDERTAFIALQAFSQLGGDPYRDSRDLERQKKVVLELLEKRNRGERPPTVH